MRFDTTEYEWAHGAKPRGFGAWMFTSEDGQLYEQAGLNSEAKKAAAAEAKEFSCLLDPNSPNYYLKVEA